MAAVITTTMTLRIILSVRGSLDYGGSFSAVWPSSTSTHTASRGVATARAPANTPSVLQITSNAYAAPTYTIQKTERGWDGAEGKSDILPIPIPENDQKPMESSEYEADFSKAPGLQGGVKITVDREVDSQL
jgi:hypothetical protein